MFTGIVQHVGTVADARHSPAGLRLAIDLGPLAENLPPGASVAVAGACLTAAGLSGHVGQFDLIGETLSRTTLGRLQRGDKVNLERALRLDQALEGHLVQGHVDGLAQVRQVRRDGEHLLELTAAPELTDTMVPKGSVAIDGVSLTLVAAEAGLFSVALIPTTLRQTTLGALRPGDEVNVETDVIGKYVLRCLRQLSAPQGLTLEKLRQAGFA